MVTLGPLETNRTHLRLLILEAPTAALPVLIHGKKYRKDAYTDDDSSPLPALNNALIMHVWASLMESDGRQRQSGMLKRQEADDKVQTQKEAEMAQAAYTTRIVPSPLNSMVDTGPRLYTGA